MLTYEGCSISHTPIQDQSRLGCYANNTLKLFTASLTLHIPTNKTLFKLPDRREQARPCQAEREARVFTDGSSHGTLAPPTSGTLPRRRGKLVPPVQSRRDCPPALQYLFAPRGQGELDWQGYAFHPPCANALRPTQLSDFGPPGSWAVITGASDGIGAEYARQLAGKRFNLVLVSRTASKLDAVGQDIKKDNPDVEIRTHPMDFAKNDDGDYAALARLVSDIDVAILINNVGVSHEIPTAFVETPSKEVKDITTVNVTGTLRTTQTIAPKMVQQKRGLIITMGSFGGIMPTAYLACYSGSKAFLQYWSSALGAELEESGVTVQFFNSYMVTSAMSKIKRTSLAVPSPKYFVKSALSSIGRSGASQGIGYTGTPYHSHSLLHWYIREAYGTTNLYVCRRLLKIHKHIRTRALAKREREAKKQ